MYVSRKDTGKHIKTLIVFFSGWRGNYTFVYVLCGKRVSLLQGKNLRVNLKRWWPAYPTPFVVMGKKST